MQCCFGRKGPWSSCNHHSFSLFRDTAAATGCENSAGTGIFTRSWKTFEEKQKTFCQSRIEPYNPNVSGTVFKIKTEAKLTGEENHTLQDDTCSWNKEAMNISSVETEGSPEAGETQELRGEIPSNKVPFKHRTLKQETGSCVGWACWRTNHGASKWASMSFRVRKWDLQEWNSLVRMKPNSARKKGCKTGKRQRSYSKVLFQRVTVNLYPRSQQTLERPPCKSDMS